MNRRFKKLIAVVCAIAMVVTSVTVYNSADVKASGSATVDGKVYTVTDGSATIVGFTCQGIFDNARIHFAWGSEVTADTIKATIDGTEVAIDGKNGHGFFIPLTAISSMEAGEYTIAVTATETATEKELTGSATLKIEDQGETTTVVAASGPEDVAWDGINWLGNGSGDASYTDRFKAYVLPTNVANLDVVNIQPKDGAACIYMPNSNSPAKAVTVNGKDIFADCKTDGAQTFVPVSALTAATYNTVVLTNVNNQELTAFIYNKTVEEPVETTPAETNPDETTPEVTTPTETTPEATTPAGEEFDPSTITDWKPLTNSTTISYYIASGKVLDGPNNQGTRIHMGVVSAAYDSIKFDGAVNEAITTEGSGVFVPMSVLTEGIHKLNVEYKDGNETFTIYFKVDKEAETTAAAYVDGAVLVDDAAVKEVPKYEGGDPWQAEFNNVPVNYVQGKKYVAEVVVSSDVAKKIKLVFQNADNWSFIDADGGYEVDIAAGNKVKITYVFEATQSTSNGNFDIYLGSVAEAATLNFESKKLTTYTEVPTGVTTGVEILSTPVVPETKVTVDGTEVAVEDGKVTLGDAEYGYLCDGKMYAPNTAITVTGDMAFTSVNELSVTMANGAGIRYAGTAGIRFQASIASDNMDAVASEAITEGTLITAKDINDAFEEELTLTYSHAKIDVKNSGWFNGQTGTYCGSICDVVESNYIRNFTARAYVTVNYENADAVTIYSNMGPARSISQVATAVKNAGYPGIPTESQSIIDSFIK